ncbi:hypothetical protein CF319_g4608 [Tilletia indica]|uniref:Uncharacterized protein n=2 Tax=Tilletia TaxID=13289 RepID=A0A8X7T290_9BASI|nr:hypothetical protein CF327_g1516 [Tilletia walkeri]KAE8222138.1 hypothetical protein CF319_g4608 [Tilletia indica]KAE8229684.1 hypothetical protein CF326_g5339 [Tilletia indica]KAE8239437.1 hypothetical protein A4X13_0g8203 [Tilletia indica]KAE8265666.1 hypothetical protein A4X09_0g6563 [Tilletia walkeri]
MFYASFITLALASAVTLTSAAITCTPYYRGQLIAYQSADSFATSRPAGYLTGVTDAQGRKILAIDGNGQPPPRLEMNFNACKSVVMKSVQEKSTVSIVSYGTVTGVKNPDKCLTAASVRKATGPTYVVSNTCTTTDTVAAQLPQWWKLTEQFGAGGTVKRYLTFSGAPAVTPAGGPDYGEYVLQSYKSKNVPTQLNGNANFLELLWTADFFNYQTPYTLGMGARLT